MERLFLIPGLHVVLVSPILLSETSMKFLYRSSAFDTSGSQTTHLELEFPGDRAPLDLNRWIGRGRYGAIKFKLAGVDMAQ